MINGVLCVTSLRVDLPTGGPCVDDGNDKQKAVKAHNAFAACDGGGRGMRGGGCMVIKIIVIYHLFPNFSQAAWAAHGLP